MKRPSLLALVLLAFVLPACGGAPAAAPGTAGDKPCAGHAAVGHHSAKHGEKPCDCAEHAGKPAEKPCDCAEHAKKVAEEPCGCPEDEAKPAAAPTTVVPVAPVAPTVKP